jgi:ATP-dependent helicase YprA (DUF1998 family)
MPEQIVDTAPRTASLPYPHPTRRKNLIFLVILRNALRRNGEEDLGKHVAEKPRNSIKELCHTRASQITTELPEEIAEGLVEMEGSGELQPLFPSPRSRSKIFS